MPETVVLSADIAETIGETSMATGKMLSEFGKSGG
jgi:hypothetical protein